MVRTSDSEFQLQEERRIFFISSKRKKVAEFLTGMKSEADKMCAGTGDKITEVVDVQDATHVVIVLTFALLEEKDQQKSLWDVHDEKKWYGVNRKRWFDIVTVYLKDNWEFYEDKNQQLKVLKDDETKKTTTGLLDKTRLDEDTYKRVLPEVIESLTGHEAMCYHGKGKDHEEQAMYREFLRRMKTIDPDTGKRRKSLSP